MDFLFVNIAEIDALMELPWSHRIAYLMAIRPYMDRKTCLVGIKRRISYQSIREVLYVAPIPGVKIDNIGLQQVRRIVKSLDRVGLISMHSTDKHLILKCTLADQRQFIQSQADMGAISQADRKESDVSSVKSTHIQSLADSRFGQQADTPHYSEHDLLFVKKKFEKFWSLYPQKKSKQNAQNVFKRINPDDSLFEVIMRALEAQIIHTDLMKAQGMWMPNWKYPANWLAQRGWEDELSTDVLQEKHHAKPTKNPKKHRGNDPFAPPIDTEERETSNVIQLQQYR